MELEKFDNVAETTEKKRWMPKPFTAEEIENVKNAASRIQSLLSEKTLIMVEAAADWKNEDKEIVAANKKALVENFGGGASIKEFVSSEEFENDLALLEGIADITSCVKAMKNQFSRASYSPRVKMSRIFINGKPYMVNSEYAQSIKDDADRREKILAHPDTKEIEIEEF